MLEGWGVSTPPPYPFNSERLARTPANISPFRPHGPNLDSFGSNGVYSNKNFATRGGVQ